MSATEPEVQVDAVAEQIEPQKGEPVANEGAQPIPDVERFADRIRAAWQSSVGGIIEAGRVLIEAKERLPHGQFGYLFKDGRVPFSQRMAQRLMEIADHPIISNPTHGSHLPPHWRTLHALTKFPQDKLTKMIGDGTINPEIERKDVERLLSCSDTTRIYRAMGILASIKGDWPEPKDFIAQLLSEDDGMIALLEDLQSLVPWMSDLLKECEAHAATALYASETEAGAAADIEPPAFDIPAEPGTETVLEAEDNEHE